MQRKLKILGLVLTLIPAIFLLLMGLGEMTGGIVSGIQHFPEFIVIAILIFWGWKKPRSGGLALTVFGLLGALGLGISAYNNGGSIETSFIGGIIGLTLPIIFGGLLLFFSQETKQ